MAEKEKMKLEDIAKQVANTEEEYNIEQAINPVLEGIGKFVGSMKTTNERGFPEYKKKLTEAERRELFDIVYESLLLNASTFYPTMTKEQLDMMKGIKSKFGDPIINYFMQTYFGLDYNQINKIEKDENFNINTAIALASDRVQRYNKILKQQTATTKTDENGYKVEDLQKFIAKAEKKYKTQEKLPKESKPEEAYGRFIDIASQYYK